jgi:hypothetical protein
MVETNIISTTKWSKKQASNTPVYQFTTEIFLFTSLSTINQSHQLRYVGYFSKVAELFKKGLSHYLKITADYSVYRILPLTPTLSQLNQLHHTKTHCRISIMMQLSYFELRLGFQTNHTWLYSTHIYSSVLFLPCPFCVIKANQLCTLRVGYPKYTEQWQSHSILTTHDPLNFSGLSVWR